MKIGDRTITAVQKLITGDAVKDTKGIAPYQSGPKLVEFFNQLGFSDTYAYQGGFPSRWVYCEDRLRQINGTPKLAKAIELALDPRRFINTEFQVATAAAYLNEYLKFDGYEVRPVRNGYRVYEAKESVVEVESDFQAVAPSGREFIQEQIEKCSRKLDEGDYDGAITNARSLTESVLLDIEKRLDPHPPKYDGDLAKLYKRVRVLLHLDPQDKKVDEALAPIVQGLSSVIHGLATTRNKMSDAHARQYRPHRHHAKLAVNAAKTVVDFLQDSFEYQQERGLIAPQGSVE